MNRWEKYRTRIPWPVDGDITIIGRDQMLRTDPNNKAKIIFGCKVGETVKQFSIWPSQLAPIADFFVDNPKATECRVTWKADDTGKVRPIVEALP